MRKEFEEDSNKEVGRPGQHEWRPEDEEDEKKRRFEEYFGRVVAR